MVNDDGLYEDDDDGTGLVCEGPCDVCDEWTVGLVMCDCGADLCDECFAGHAHNIGEI